TRQKGASRNCRRGRRSTCSAYCRRGACDLRIKKNGSHQNVHHEGAVSHERDDRKEAAQERGHERPEAAHRRRPEFGVVEALPRSCGAPHQRSGRQGHAQRGPTEPCAPCGRAGLRAGANGSPDVAGRGGQSRQFWPGGQPPSPAARKLLAYSAARDVTLTLAELIAQDEAAQAAEEAAAAKAAAEAIEARKAARRSRRGGTPHE